MQYQIYRFAIHVWSTSSAPSVSAIMVSDESEGGQQAYLRISRILPSPPSPKNTPKKTQIPSVFDACQRPHLFIWRPYYTSLYIFKNRSLEFEGNSNVCVKQWLMLPAQSYCLQSQFLVIFLLDLRIRQVACKAGSWGQQQ